MMDATPSIMKMLGGPGWLALGADSLADKMFALTILRCSVFFHNEHRLEPLERLVFGFSISATNAVTQCPVVNIQLRLRHRRMGCRANHDLNSPRQKGAVEMGNVFSEKFDRVISLGVDCRVKFQISLNLYKRKTGNLVDMHRFESALYSCDKNVFPDGNFFFDWLVSYFQCVTSCIENDFNNVFKKENLEITGGTVTDRGSGLIFVHNFEHKNGGLDWETIDRDYEEQRAKVFHLKDKFIEHLQNGPKTLYVVCGAQEDAVVKFCNVIGAKHPNHNFAVLSVCTVQEPRGLIVDADKYAIYEIDEKVNKPQNALWQGDDVQWGAVLDKVDLKV